MRTINKICIVGGEPMSQRIGGFLARTNVKVSVISAGKGLASELTEADCTIENLYQDEVRKQFFEEYEPSPERAICATTALWNITEIAAVTKRPDNFVGLKFKENETTGEWLVQVTKGFETSTETVETCCHLLQESGAVPIVIEDSPGLVLYRPIVAAINEGALMSMTGIASIEDMDEAVRIRRRWPKGLFEIADEMGIDVVVKILEAMAAQMGDQYLPCLLLRKMVAAGRLGKKTGRGFYAYPKD